MFNKKRETVPPPESTYIVKNYVNDKRRECCYYASDEDGCEQLCFRYFERPNLKKWTKFDKFGREEYSLDSNGVEVRWLYLQNGWKEKHIKEGEECVEIYAYDENDVCRDVMFQRFEPKKYFRRTSYDARGYKGYCLFPDGRVERYEYYEDGRVKSKDILLADGIAQQIVFDFKEDQLRGLNFGENSETPSPKAFTDFVDTVKSPSQK